MVNSPNHPSQLGFTLTPDPHHSDADASGNSLLNSASPFPFQNQTLPMSGQLISNYHVNNARLRRLNTSLGLCVTFNTIRPQHNVNLNIIIGNNSSVNINLFSGSHPPFRFPTTNPFAPSSSTPVRSNFYNHASSNIQQSLLIPDTSEHMPNRFRTYGIPQIIRHHSQERPTAIPSLNQNRVTLSPNQRQPTHPCQQYPSQNLNTQSGAGLNLFNQPSQNFPSRRHNLLHTHPSSSTQNLKKHQVLVPSGESSTCPKNSYNSLSNLPTSDIRPETKEIAIQDPEPNFNRPPSNTELPTGEHDPRKRRCHQSSMRSNSHPYVKYGPYTCPSCGVIFESGHRFASHMQIHYKDETPSERKERRERKIRKRDLHIAQSTNGLTVMPGYPQVQNEPSLVENVADRTTNQVNQGEHLAPVIIKEEKEE